MTCSEGVWGMFFYEKLPHENIQMNFGKKIEPKDIFLSRLYNALWRGFVSVTCLNSILLSNKILKLIIYSSEDDKL